MIELLAMSPSGEVVFVSDHSERVWEQRLLSNAPARIVGLADVDRAVVDHGYTRIGESLESWADLHAALDRLVERPDARELPVNETVAQAMIPIMRDWLRSPIDRGSVASLVNKLLRSPEVAANDDLRLELLDLQASAATPVTGRPTVPTARLAVVDEFFAAAA
ncbi:MAG: hypothetical protein GY704_17785 [Phycisphaeraceae bacterium]|nr:hypothetical protein [Phycisphaeraceae bacterium]